MLEALYSLDVWLFRFGNQTVANPIGDVFFPYITELKNFELVYAVLLVGLIIRFKKRGLVAVLILLLTVVASDQISSALIKPLVGRIRPCFALENVRMLIGCGGGKSFPSSHAVNNFAAATCVVFFFRKALPYAMSFASLEAISRVYVGVHYPSDILGGAILGWLIAFTVYKMYVLLTAAVPRLHSFAPSEILRV